MNTLDKELAKLERELEHVSKATLQQAGELGVEEARGTDLFKHGNKFEQAITFQPIGGMQGRVESGAEYSGYLEYGNDQAGNIIYPKAGNVLHFTANGEDVFAKHVKAHGPLPFMDQAADEVEKQLPNLWAHEFDKLVK